MRARHLFYRSLAVLVTVVSLAVMTFGGAPETAQAATWYVSKTASGDNSGTSWANAWTSLANIDWNQVQPGDTILIDGGPNDCADMGVESASCGMVYQETLNIGKSGLPGQPITIKLAPDVGRNGAVVLDGGVSDFTYCADNPPESGLPAAGGTDRSTGVHFGGRSWVVLDGTKWGGIIIRNYVSRGINLSSGDHNVVRFVKIHHINNPADTTNNSRAIGDSWESDDNLVEFVEAFRSGQDAMWISGDRFTLRYSYIHDHYCNHPDGIQAFVPTNNSGVDFAERHIAGMTVEHNIFKSVGLQHVFLGENVTHNSPAIDVVIRDNIFIAGNVPDPFYIKSKHGETTNWLVEHNTFVGPTTAFSIEWCCGDADAPMVIRNNVFYRSDEGSSAFWLPTDGGSTLFQNNCLYRTGSRNGDVSESGTIVADPMFANIAADDYNISPSSACFGKGAREIQSLAELIGQGQAVATATPTALPTKTPTPTGTLAPTATPPASLLRWHNGACWVLWWNEVPQAIACLATPTP